MNKILLLSKYITREALRNKAELFFPLFFPIIFLVIFGFVFNSESGNNTLSIILYADDNIDYYVSELSKIYIVKTIDDINDVNENIKKGNYDIGITIKNGKVSMYIDDANLNQKSFVQNLELELKKIVMKNKVNIDYIKVNETKIAATGIHSKYIDYLLTGVIAISLLSNGMFSVITVFGRYKKLNILKRFILIPIKSYVFVIGMTLTRIIISLFSLVLLIFMGKFIFNSGIEINWFLYFILAFTSTIGMMGIGLLFLFLFKKGETAQNAASIFFTIMMFFSGVYFPVEFLPKAFRIISYILPIKYIVDSLRFIAGIDIMRINTFVILNVIMFLGGSLLLIIASKKFLTPEK